MFCPPLHARFLKNVFFLSKSLHIFQFLKNYGEKFQTISDEGNFWFVAITVLLFLKRSFTKSRHRFFHDRVTASPWRGVSLLSVNSRFFSKLNTCIHFINTIIFSPYENQTRAIFAFQLNFVSNLFCVFFYWGSIWSGRTWIEQDLVVFIFVSFVIPERESCAFFESKILKLFSYNYYNFKHMLIIISSIRTIIYPPRFFYFYL